MSKRRARSRAPRPRGGSGPAGQRAHGRYLDVLDEVQDEDLDRGPSTGVERAFGRAAARMSAAALAKSGASRKPRRSRLPRRARSASTVCAWRSRSPRSPPSRRPHLAAFLRAPDVVSRIGYVETADAIERWTGVRPALSRETSVLAPGDIAMVVRLRYHIDPARKGTPAATGDTDWEIGLLERLS